MKKWISSPGERMDMWSALVSVDPQVLRLLARRDEFCDLIRLQPLSCQSRRRNSGSTSSLISPLATMPNWRSITNPGARSTITLYSTGSSSECKVSRSSAA